MWRLLLLLLAASAWAADDRGCPVPLIALEGLDRVALLRGLWEQQQPAGLPPPGWEGEGVLAKDAVARGPIDYFSGRLITMDLSGEYACPAAYDASLGTPSAAALVAVQLRGVKVYIIDTGVP